MKKYVIEFQGFYCHDKFCFKELSVYNIEEKQLKHFLIKSPFRFIFLSEKEKRGVRYCEKHLHKIFWNNGVEKFNEVKNFLHGLITPNDIVYTKGENKVKVLESFFNFGCVIYDVNDFNIFTNLQEKETFFDCPLPFHKDNRFCSHWKAQKIAKSLSENESVHEKEPIVSTEAIQMSSDSEKEAH